MGEGVEMKGVLPNYVSMIHDLLLHHGDVEPLFPQQQWDVAGRDEAWPACERTGDEELP